MEVFLEILYRFGLPTALLLLLAWERFHTVKKKDAQIAAMSIAHGKAITKLATDKDEELKRINEARIAEQAGSTDRSVKVATEFIETTAEHQRTLAMMVDRFGGLTSAVERLERTVAGR